MQYINHIVGILSQLVHQMVDVIPLQGRVETLELLGDGSDEVRIEIRCQAFELMGHLLQFVWSPRDCQQVQLLTQPGSVGNEESGEHSEQSLVVSDTIADGLQIDEGTFDDLKLGWRCQRSVIPLETWL